MDASFKGTGWSFPPSFGNNGATVDMVSGDEDIHQSIGLLLETEPGERVMRPDFGCGLSNHLFEEIDQGLINRITRSISEAILHHEPRVVLEALDVNPAAASDGTLLIRLEYRSRLTNSRYNLVYPFYLREAAIDPAEGG